MNIKLIDARTTNLPAGRGYTATDDLWPTNRIAVTPIPTGYTATDDLWK